MSSYEFSYVTEELLGTGIVSALFSAVPSSILGIATYILTALALYTVAQRRGLNRPWLAWIPVVNCWIIGSLSDQYRYVVKGEVKSKRKVLLILNILTMAVSLAMGVVGIVVAVNAVGGVMGGISESQMLRSVMGPVVGLLGLSLPLAAVSIASAVIRFMALYDIYRSMDPANGVLYLVLSILFRVTEPFFLFFNRNKDLGMPPRRQEYQEPVYQEPVYQDYVYEQPAETPPRSTMEPWEQTDNKDYL